MPDEFDRRRDMFRKERRINREKHIGRPFSSVVKEKNTFKK